MARPRSVFAFIIIHPQISKPVTSKIIFDTCGWRFIKATAFLGVVIICSVLVWCLAVPALLSFDRHLFCIILRRGKTYHINQRWRHTTCLQHICYDVGCYPWQSTLVLSHSIQWCAYWNYSKVSWTFLLEDETKMQSCRRCYSLKSLICHGIHPIKE